MESSAFFFFGIGLIQTLETLSARICAFIYLQSHHKGLYFKCDLTCSGYQYSTKKLPKKNLPYQNNKYTNSSITDINNGHYLKEHFLLLCQYCLVNDYLQKTSGINYLCCNSNIIQKIQNLVPIFH